MNDILVLVGIVAGWIVLNFWILPWFGIRTCMSGACRIPQVERTKPRIDADNAVRINKTLRGQERP